MYIGLHSTVCSAEICPLLEMSNMNRLLRTTSHQHTKHHINILCIMIVTQSCIYNPGGVLGWESQIFHLIRIIVAGRDELGYVSQSGLDRGSTSGILHSLGSVSDTSQSHSPSLSSLLYSFNNCRGGGAAQAHPTEVGLAGQLFLTSKVHTCWS